jgi:membrane protein
MLCFVIVVMTAVLALPIALGFVGLHPVTETLIHVARWPLLLVIVTVMLAFIYR